LILRSLHTAPAMIALVSTAGVSFAQANVTAYAIPEAPAFTFLSAAPAEVQRPTSPRSLVTSLVSGIGADGLVQQGFALDVAPWSLIPSLRIPLSAYQQNPGSFLLANTQLSIATVRTPGDDGTTDLSLGMRLTLWDKSDPMVDPAFTSVLRSRILTGCVPEGPTSSDSVKLLECAGRINQEARQIWRHSGKWNRSSLALAGAFGTRLDQSRFDRHRWLGWSAWATGAFPMTRSGQILAQLRYDERTVTRGNPKERTLRYGTRAFMGGAAVNAFVEVVGVDRIEAPPGTDEAAAHWSAGIEFRAGEELWLSTGFGNGSGGGSDRALVLAGLRWNVLDAPRFQTR